MDARVRDVLAKKRGCSVVTIACEATVRAAVAVMVAHQVGSVLATDEGGSTCGILTERECVERMLLEGQDPQRSRVADIMRRQLVVVTPDEQIEACMALMTANRCRHLPVMRDGNVVGVLSIGDCVAHLCDVAMHENAALFAYITGRYPG
jgi:signal-transduction protein with cAMP-binding, CBS, and nucleotidyltransferase domain